jgi:ribonuclease HI
MEISFTWAAGHEGSKANEVADKLADKLAKEAAEFGFSDDPRLAFLATNSQQV